MLFAWKVTYPPNEKPNPAQLVLCTVFLTFSLLKEELSDNYIKETMTDHLINSAELGNTLWKLFLTW